MIFPTHTLSFFYILLRVNAMLFLITRSAAPSVPVDVYSRRIGCFWLRVSHCDVCADQQVWQTQQVWNER